MSGLLRCLFQMCCEEQQDDSRLQDDSISWYENDQAPQSPQENTMSMRLLPMGNDDNNDSSIENNQPTIFFGRPLTMDIFRHYNNSIWSISNNDEERNDDKKEDAAETTGSSSALLRNASTFKDDDRGQGLFSISSEEIVVPGSEIQRKMAQRMLEKLNAQDEVSEAAGVNIGDECVVCMEGFDYENPRVPTLCGCGENKTNFHLPCLYQWIQQQGSNNEGNCPSCRTVLRWEELSTQQN